MGKFNIDRIVGHISDHPLLEPNKFEVTITGPILIPEFITFNCHRCDIPALSIGTFEHSIVGPKRKIPNEEIYDNISMSFYNSKYIEEFDIMKEWMRMIAGEDYRLAYYNDIVADINIAIYDHQEHLTATVKLAEAYPVGVSELELSFAGETPSDTTVNFTYHSYEIIRQPQ